MRGRVDERERERKTGKERGERGQTCFYNKFTLVIMNHSCYNDIKQDIRTLMT
jgi:hypothetical protein